MNNNWKQLLKEVKTKIQAKKRTLQNDLERDGKLDKKDTYPTLILFGSG